MEDLAGRLDVQTGSGAVFSRAREVGGSSFAGGYFDVREGQIRVFFTDHDAQRNSAILEVARRPDAVVFGIAANSWEQLTAQKERIYADRDAAQEDGLRVVGAGLDPWRNKVRLNVVDPPENAVDVLARRFDVQASTLVIHPLSNDRPESANDSEPYGGHYLNGCSNGAFGYVWGIFGQAPYLVTAGHCGETLYHTDNGEYGESPHSPSFTTNTEQDSGSTDSQKMNIGGSPPWTTSVKIEGWYVPDFTIVNAATAGDDYDYYGHVVCQAGANTEGFLNCDEIFDIDEDCDGHTNLRIVGYNRDGGDSGASVYGFPYLSSNATLAGFHRAGNANCSGPSYSFHSYALSAHGLDGWYFG